MNKNLWIGIGVAVVIIVAGVFLMKGNNNTQAPSSATGTNAGTAQQTSLKDLLAMGGSRQCTFSDAAGSANIQGTVYLSGGKMRGDFNSVAQGKTTATHMIVMDNVAYTWIDGMSTAFKIAFDKMQAQSQASAKGVDVNKSINYSCSPWAADSSKFTLPAGVSFTDMSAMLPGGSASGTVSGGTSGGANCSACNSVPAAYQAQCRASLGCK